MLFLILYYIKWEVRESKKYLSKSNVTVTDSMKKQPEHVSLIPSHSVSFFEITQQKL